MVKIVLAEDQGMLLGALSTLLNLEDDLEVIGQATNGHEAVELVRKLKPDICIMDIEMPIKTGLDAAEELVDVDCKIIILTTFAKPGYFARARAVGVSGYLLKDGPSDDLSSAIRTIMNGQKVYAPELIDQQDKLIENPLTNREMDVIELVSQGKSTKEIAYTLFITEGTVRNYISIILDKLNVSNRIEAISKFKEFDYFK